MVIQPILHNTDVSKGFMKKKGNLYIPGAEVLIPRINQFYADIKPGNFLLSLFTNDTHFEGEYIYSDEHIHAHFPFHQGFGTYDHQYAIDVSILNRKMAVYHMLKNKFDMWAKNSYVNVPYDQIKFENDAERHIYDNLFTIARMDKNGVYDFLFHRNVFFDDLPTTSVAILGVAEDYCDRDAITGYLARGFEVTMLNDLTMGIYNPGDEPGQDPDGVNNWDELVEKHFAEAVKSGQLRTMKSADYLATLTAW